MTTSNRKSEIEVGEWVLFPLGRNRLEAQVIEDRGNLGVRGERILRISVPMEEGVEAFEYEVTEAELLRAA